MRPVCIQSLWLSQIQPGKKSSDILHSFLTCIIFTGVQNLTSDQNTLTFGCVYLVYKEMNYLYDIH